MPKKQKSGYRYHPLGFVDAELSLGSHLCCFYEDKEQQFSVLRPFLGSGIRNGEKCISIGTSGLSLEVKAELATEFDVRELIEKRALEFIEEVDLRVKGELDARKVLRFVKSLVARTLKEGWPSCRIAGEWAWLLQTAEDREGWLEYEAMLNMALPELPAIIICQYNVDEITGRFMMDIMRTHPMVILSGSLYENDYYIEPEEFLQERISGTEHIH
jgi:hypothetical protein